MQCPICKKDLEIKNKKIGENEAGEAIYNEFAICRDCKKQWNLDKQREKKKKLAKEALAEKTVEAGKAAEKPHKKRPASEGEKTSAERPAQPKKKKKRPVSPENTEKRTASSANPEVPGSSEEKTSEPGCRRRKTGKKTSSEDRRFFRRTAIQTASKETPCYFRPSTSQICRRSGRKPGKSSSTSEKETSGRSQTGTCN